MYTCLEGDAREDAKVVYKADGCSESPELEGGQLLRNGQ